MNDTPQQSPPASPPPPRGPSTLVILAIVLIGAGMLVVGVAFSGGIKSAAASLRGMASRGRDTAGVDDPHAKKQYYTCGMHPWVIQPRPGDCPICHMKLTPLDPSRLTGEIAIDPVVTQNIGVRVAAVTSGPVTHTVRAFGNVVPEETKVFSVTVRAKSRIEKWYDTRGIGVRKEKGAPLVELHSPDIIVAAREMLMAREAAKSLPGSAAASDSLLEASKSKLHFLGLPAEQIEDILKTNRVPETYTLGYPSGGVLSKITGNVGGWVDEGAEVAEVIDYSTVWVIVSLFESQMPLVQAGQKATMTIAALPGQVFEGKIEVIYPTINEQTRQGRARLVFDNRELVLKPGMYTRVEIATTLRGEQVLAPREAVIDTGERRVAFVSLGGGKFETRSVTTGTESDGGMIEVLDGLKPGEKVVTSGQFLLDSESRMRESLAKMIRGELASEQHAPAAEKSAAPTPELPPPAAAALGDTLRNYFQIGDRLASDTLAGIAEPARATAASVDALIKIEFSNDPHFWHRHTEAAVVRGKALELIEEKSLAGAREKFADLSIALGKLVTAAGVPAAIGKPVEELRCPMFREGQGGGYWLQMAGEVRNPFFGKSMLGCFDQRETLPAAREAKKP